MMTNGHWKRGDLALAGGQLVQVRFSLKRPTWPDHVSEYFVCWAADGQRVIVYRELLEAPDVLTLLASVDQNPFVWWRIWPKRLRRLFSSAKVVA